MLQRFEGHASILGQFDQGLVEPGFGLPKARTRAFLLYSYEVAESLLTPQVKPAHRQERQRLVEQLLKQPLAPASAP